MTMTFLGLSRPVEPQSLSSRRVVILVFVAAIFLSACLLFSVQPMFAKMVLPRLGGAASVWSIAMVFFQAMLLAGYLYAHLLTRYVPFRLAFAIHLCVLAVAFLAMPIAIAQGFGRPPASGEATWLIGLFAASVGLPFFAVAGNGPLLQAWFARTGHPDAQNPYFLYGASNIGSFAALLAYPLILEPGLTLREQSQLWMIGFVLLAVLIAGCALLVFRAAPGETRAANHLVVSPAPTARQRAEWAALAFIPSALLVAVTAHIATDVASAPFMWVIPLALFLASFVLVFRSRELVSHRMLLGIQPLATGGLAIVLVFARWLPIEISLTLHLTIFMILATICHGALYRRRPDAGRLTEFYLWMSFGGALGGAFAGLAAPHLFNSVAEYPILLAMALIARPGLLEAGLTVWKREAAPIALLAAILLAPGLLIDGGLDPDRTTLFLCGLAILTILMQWQHARPVRLLALGALTLALSQVYEPGLSHAVYVRSFFGVHKVVDIADGRIRLLFNGTTIHGAERLRDDGGQPVSGRPEPLTYYHQKGPFQEAIQAARAQANGRLTHVALVGLGVGALACSRAPDETWTFYEIDPELVRLSAESGLFRTIPTCAAGQKIISGDARLTLPDSPEAFDLIVLDAYSSDNVPVHLLTREAMELWKSKLRPGGMIAMNITNRNISLAEIVSASADAAGLRMRRKQDSSSVDFEKTFHARAQIAVLAREPQDFGALDEATGWTDTIPDPAQRLWTDDYSDIVGAILRRWY